MPNAPAIKQHVESFAQESKGICVAAVARGDCPEPQLAGQDEQHCYEQGGQGIVI